MPATDPPHNFRYPQWKWEQITKITALRGTNNTAIITERLDEYWQENHDVLKGAREHTCTRCGWKSVTGLRKDLAHPGDWLCMQRKSCTRRVRQREDYKIAETTQAINDDKADRKAS